MSRAATRTASPQLEGCEPAGQLDHRALLDAAPAALVVTDGAGTIVLANARALTLFGHARADLLGRPVDVLLAGRSVAAFRRRFAHCVRRVSATSAHAVHGLRRDG